MFQKNRMSAKIVGCPSGIRATLPDRLMKSACLAERLAMEEEFFIFFSP